MNGTCFVTAITGPEPLEWGLKIDRIAVPMVLLCSPDMAPVLSAGAPPYVRVVATDLPHPLSAEHRIARLRDACRARHNDAGSYYWLDARLIYQHLSFEFLYSDLLARAIARFAPAPSSFLMPGYEASSFFGGPTAAIDSLADTPGDPLEHLFGTPFDRQRLVDLNLSLAAVVDEPVLHVVGDSHVFNCFTVNAAIGCRPNVLVRTPDVSRTRVPYAYQFTHHLGSRTMHFAGRSGALLGVAKECGVKAGDAIVWVFGEIDARSHILRQRDEHGRTLDDVIDTLARDYVRGILEVQRAYEGVRSIVFAPIPPLDNPGYSSDDFPVHGSIDERIAATRQLRGALAALCDQDGLHYLDVSAHYESARGDLRWELSDHFCHIASSAQGPAVDALYDLLSPQPSA